MPVAPTPDDLLVQGLLARRPEAWKRLLEAYGGVIAAACRRALTHQGLAPDRPEVADAAADIVGKLLEDDLRLLRRHRPGTPLGIYLSVIAYTQTRRRPPAPVPEPAATQDDVSEALQVTERIARLREALAALPSRDAEVLRLFHLDGLRYPDIAKRLMVPEAQVGVLLLRAREKLRAALGEDFLDSV